MTPQFLVCSAHEAALWRMADSHDFDRAFAIASECPDCGTWVSE